MPTYGAYTDCPTVHEYSCKDACLDNPLIVPSVYIHVKLPKGRDVTSEKSNNLCIVRTYVGVEFSINVMLEPSILFTWLLYDAELVVVDEKCRTVLNIGKVPWWTWVPLVFRFNKAGEYRLFIRAYAIDKIFHTKVCATDAEVVVIVSERPSGQPPTGGEGGEVTVSRTWMIVLPIALSLAMSGIAIGIAVKKSKKG